MLCQHQGCTVQASFGPPGTSNRLLCATHKPPEWTHQTMCDVSGCTKPAKFAKTLADAPNRCNKHRRAKDVVNKRCSFCRCYARWYQVDSSSRMLCCPKHKTELCLPLRVSVLPSKRDRNIRLSLAEIADLLGVKHCLIDLLCAEVLDD